MRRRQLWAQQASPVLTVADVPPVEFDERRFVQIANEMQLISVPPGSCPKCLRHIGRGVAMHKKRCQGVSDG